MIWPAVLIYVGIALIAAMLLAAFVDDIEKESVSEVLLMAGLWPLGIAVFMGFIIRAARK